MRRPDTRSGCVHPLGPETYVNRGRAAQPLGMLAATRKAWRAEVQTEREIRMTIIFLLLFVGLRSQKIGKHISPADSRHLSVLKHTDIGQLTYKLRIGS